MKRTPLTRTKPMPKASKPIVRKVKVKARNHRRSTREFVRCYESRERQAWVRSFPCSVPGCVVSPCDNAHSAGDGGMGRKASARYVLPLCRAHHREQHRVGVASFEAKYGFRLADEAARIQHLWEHFCDGGWEHRPEMWAGHQ